MDASFEFINDGDTVTVKVGFPDFGYGYAGTFKGVRENNTFETWVNGESCRFENVPGKIHIKSNVGQEVDITDPKILDEAHTNLQKYKGIMYQDVIAMTVDELRWLVKEVTFSGGEVTRTRVRYTAGYGSYAGFTHLEYLYGTGRTWKNSIGQAVFVVRTSPEVWMQRVPQFARGGASTNTRSYTKRRGGEFEHEYILTDVEPFENDVFRIFDKNSSQKIVQHPWEEYGEFIFSDKPVNEDFLDILSLSQLWLFRNAFYARHGKVFTEPDLDTQFRNTYWYNPREDYSDTDLTDIEKENIRKIIAKEQWLKEIVENNKRANE